MSHNVDYFQKGSRSMGDSRLVSCCVCLRDEFMTREHRIKNQSRMRERERRQIIKDRKIIKGGG